MNAPLRAALRGAWRVPALACLALGLAGAARAQDDLVPPRTWSVKLGAFLPSNSSMQDQASDVWWYAGVDYFPNLRYRPLSADVHVGLDGAWRAAGGRNVSIMSLTGKLIWSLTPPDAKLQVWGGAGAGVWFIKSQFLRDRWEPGLKFVLGVDLNERWFVEADYDYTARYTDPLGNGLNGDGVTIAGGYRF